MASDGTILSQDAIDALLNGTSEESVDAPVTNAAVVTHDKETPNLAGTSPSETLRDAELPSEMRISRDEVIEIAGEAAEAEALPIQNSMNRISQRVDALEVALARIAELEQQVSWLRNMI